MFRFTGVFICAISAALGQQTAKPLEFEVASIKPASPDAHGSSLMTGKGNDLTVTNMPLHALITFAYDIKDFQLSGGPGWVGTERYDISAKPARGGQEPPDPRMMTDQQRAVRDGQLKEEVRTLLADRFSLVVHKETKEQPIYLLTVAKNGPKLKEVTTPGDRQGTTGGRGRSQGYAAAIAWLANTLAHETGRPVVDQTGLTGKYDYILEWTPDVGEGGVPADVPGPTIFTALQEQLGLKLESSKGPVENVVIDHVDKPSAN